MGSLETWSAVQVSIAVFQWSLCIFIPGMLTYSLSPRLIIPAKQLVPLTLQPGSTGPPHAPCPQSRLPLWSGRVSVAIAPGRATASLLG